MRIAFSGSHRVGKSTLVELVGDALPRYSTVDEPYALLEEEGYEPSDPPSLEDFEAQLERSLDALDEGDADVLFDRCPADVLAYLLVHDDANAFDIEEWLDRTRAPPASAEAPRAKTRYLRLVSTENEPDGRSFDDEGRLKSRSLRGPETIDGIPCSPNRPVTFHANGRIESAELAGPFASQHGILPRGTFVELDDSKRIVRVTLSEPAMLATKNFSSGVTIAFPQDGPPRIDG